MRATEMRRIVLLLPQLSIGTRTKCVHVLQRRGCRCVVPPVHLQKTKKRAKNKYSSTRRATEKWCRADCHLMIRESCHDVDTRGSAVCCLYHGHSCSVWRFRVYHRDSSVSRAQNDHPPVCCNHGAGVLPERVHVFKYHTEQ